MTNQPDSNGGQTGIPARSGAPGAPGAQGVQGAEGSGLSSNSPHAEEPQLDPQTRKQATRAMLKYGAARLGLFLGLTIVIQALAVLIGAQVPLVVSALLALLVALQLSMLIFKKLRIETTEAVAKLAQQRRARKEWVNRELAGR